jgi:DNA-binding transcriptional MerR regulator
MGLDIVKLKELQKKLQKEAQEEIMQNISENLINFVLDQDLTHSFREVKGRIVTEQSKRVIGHWVKKGVITAEQTKEGGWYYFDRTESIWIDIVTQLREFGLELDKIIKIREQLFTETVKDFKMIDFALMSSILREPYIMIVEMDGSIRLLTSTLYSQVINNEVLPPHIVFNFFHLAKKIFPNNNFHLGEENTKNNNLSSKELKLLYYLRTGDYEEIKIRMSGGEIYLLEGKKKIVYQENLMKIIKKSAYQDIEIKTENGRIVHFGVTEKTKIN